MSDNIVLEHLKAIRAKVDKLDQDGEETRQHLGHLEHQYATISTRLDRQQATLELISKRLELVD